MASAQSLLGLVNQLQTMESSFCDVLMEAALKLASLTDANVFVMVETAEGRRFAGKRHLCDSYINGGLCPIGSDMEMEVDPTVKGLRQRLITGNSPANQFQPQSSIHTPPRFEPSNNGSRMVVSPFGNPEIFPTTQFIRKRSHLGAGFPSSPSPRKQQKSFHNDGATPEGSAQVKEERDVFGDEDVTGREGEEDVIEAFDEMPPTGLAVGERSKNSNNDAFAMLPFGSDSHGEGYDFSTDFDPGDLFASPKLMALERVCTHESLSDKSSYASKLLSSFITDCGKALLKGCVKNNTHPDDRRAYFAQGFEHLWASLSFLKRLDEDGLRIQKGTENRRLSLRATVRDKMLTTFRAHMKRGPDRGLVPCAGQRPLPQFSRDRGGLNALGMGRSGGVHHLPPISPLAITSHVGVTPHDARHPGSSSSSRKRQHQQHQQHQLHLPQMDSSHDEPPNVELEATNDHQQEMTHRDLHLDSVHLDSSHLDVSHHDNAAHHDNASLDASHIDTGHLDATAHHESAHLDASHVDASHHDASHHAASHHDPAHLDEMTNNNDFRDAPFPVSMSLSMEGYDAS